MLVNVDLFWVEHMAQSDWVLINRSLVSVYNSLNVSVASICSWSVLQSDIEDFCNGEINRKVDHIQEKFSFAYKYTIMYNVSKLREKICFCFKEPRANSIWLSFIMPKSLQTTLLAHYEIFSSANRSWATETSLVWLMLKIIIHECKYTLHQTMFFNILIKKKLIQV